MRRQLSASTHKNIKVTDGVLRALLYLVLWVVLSVIVIESPATAAIIDIMLVVDSTGGYQAEVASIRSSLLNALDNSFDPGDDVQMGLVTFSDAASFDLDIGSPIAVLNALASISSSGLMEVGAQAVSLATTATFRANSSRHIIVFTDESGDMTPQEISDAGNAVLGLPGTLWVNFGSLTESTQNYQDLLVAAGSTDGNGQPLLFFGVNTQAGLTMGNIFSEIDVRSMAPVPMPSSIPLFATGLACLVGWRWRKERLS